MGQVVPEGFELSGLANEAERRVVEAFRDGLSDGWLILPSVHLRSDHRDYELDVVLIHQGFGIIDIEVKGHRVSIESGRWTAGGTAMDPQPLDQARSNAYALRALIRAEVPSLARIEVEYGVALPNSTAVDGRLPPGVSNVQVLTAASFEDVTDAIEQLACERTNNVVLAAADVEALVGVLCPDADFAFDPNARIRWARRRLDELCGAQTQVLERLDANRRVVALGAAGTGKTRLAVAWALRAFARGERVLLTCYNDPLAARAKEQLPVDAALRIGSFFEVACGLAGMPPLVVPADADHPWWNQVAIGHLLANWHLVEERFDTIVVDEAQDFSPAWLAQLERLLDEDGPRRLLLAADPDQDVYERGFAVPSTDDGWTRCELISNCRNAREIGTLLRRRLGGAPAPSVGPEATDLAFVSLTDVSDQSGAGDACGVARAELDRLLLDEEREHGEIAVLTFSSSLRDRLRENLALVSWEERSSGVVCETVHRTKGLEFGTVLLVGENADMTDALLKIGISRAVAELVIVGPPLLATRLGLTPRSGAER